MHPGDFIITPSWTCTTTAIRAASRSSGSTASTSRWSLLRRRFRRDLSRGRAAGRPEGDGSRAGARTCRRSTNAARRYHAGIRLSVRAQPRGARTLARPRRRRVSRHQAALREPGDRRLSDADDRGLPAAAARRLRRRVPQTDGTVYCVVEGRPLVGSDAARCSTGTARHFVVPSWCTRSAGKDAVLFSFSDRPVQKAIGLWREDRRPATGS